MDEDKIKLIKRVMDKHPETRPDKSECIALCNLALDAIRFRKALETIREDTSRAQLPLTAKINELARQALEGKDD